MEIHAHRSFPRLRFYVVPGAWETETSTGKQADPALQMSPKRCSKWSTKVQTSLLLTWQVGPVALRASLVYKQYVIRTKGVTSVRPGPQPGRSCLNEVPGRTSQSVYHGRTTVRVFSSGSMFPSQLWTSLAVRSSASYLTSLRLCFLTFQRACTPLSH